MTLLPSWPDLSIQMASIHLVACPCGSHGALGWGSSVAPGSHIYSNSVPVVTIDPDVNDDTATSTEHFSPHINLQNEAKTTHWICLDRTEPSK